MMKKGYRCRERKEYYKRKRIWMMVLGILLIAVIFMTKVSVAGASSEKDGRYKYYTSVYVDRNVSLWTISEKYISEEYADTQAYIDEVKAINHLMDEQLEYGTTICVPYYSDEFK